MEHSQRVAAASAKLFKPIYACASLYRFLTFFGSEIFALWQWTKA